MTPEQHPEADDAPHAYAQRRKHVIWYGWAVVAVLLLIGLLQLIL